MKTIVWLVDEPSESDPNIAVTIEYTEEKILEEYWDYWKSQMETRFYVGHKSITKENCIDDWVIVNWAYRKTGAQDVT